ncbi:MAG: Smr/MutS family protein [Bacteroidota bacterium]|nr:Smr/MutS family protein [Bacteroidota bacterium]
MKFEIGDKVTVLHSNEDGEVVDIINEKMVLVEVRGVKFPAYTDQLDFPYFKQFTQKKQVPAPKPKTYIDQLPREKQVVTGPKHPAGVWLMFLPKFDTDEFGDEVVDLLRVHLINGTNTEFRFEYKVLYAGKPGFDLRNELLVNQNFYVHDIPFENLNDSPVFACEFSLVKPDKKKAAYFETSLKLKAQQLFKKIEEIKAKGEATFSYKLFDTYPDYQEEEKMDMSKLTNAGFKVYEASKARQHLAPARSVVDLHIEKITDNWEQLSNFEILTIQLREFEKFLELAFAHHQASVTFIHGVGTGKLRDELHDLLKQKKEVKYFVNQYHPSYGYGATEVFLKY